MRIEILSSAEDDLLDGYFFYERQGRGLGEYFWTTLFAEIDSLRLNAGLHAIHHNCHRMPSHRFPFAIYHQVEHDVVRVRAVFDCRQDPIKIRRRLK